MNKELKKIFVFLSLYAFAGGLFYNFQQLWMLENNMSLKTIGIVFSLCSLIAVSMIFICSNLVKVRRLKSFSQIMIALKVILLFIVFLLHNSGLNILIKFLIMVDFALDVEIFICSYPMISLITKSDKIYASRGLVYDMFYFLGVLLTSLLLGKSILLFNINYNFYNLLASITLLFAFIVISSLKIDNYYKKDDDDNNAAFYSLIKSLKEDKISKLHLLYVFMGDISYYAISGLLLSILTNKLDMSPTYASNLLLALGIGSVVVGIIILRKLTLKNNYINFLIKFGVRFVLYTLAFIFANKYIFLISIIYLKLSSDAYTHVTDAPYVNRFDNDYQLAFCNLRSMVGYFSRSIGTLICGLAVVVSVRINFLIAAVFIFFQIYFGIKSITELRLENDRK